MKKFLSYLTLFGSTGTLLCCALPTLFVALGMGATVAGVVTHIPQIVWLSERKALVFGFTALMLGLSGFLLWRSRNDPCPIDPDLAAACGKSRTFALWIYFISLGVFGIGVLFAYVLPLLLYGE